MYNTVADKIMYGRIVAGCQTGTSGVYDSCCPVNGPGLWRNLVCLRVHTIGIKTCTTAFDFIADDSTDKITASGHTLADGDITALTTTHTLPDPLQFGTNYYVVNLDVNGKFKLSLTEGGSAINITNTGIGTHTLSVPDLITGLNDKVFCLGGIGLCEFRMNTNRFWFDWSEFSVLVIRKFTAPSPGAYLFNSGVLDCAPLPMNNIANPYVVGDCGVGVQQGYEGFVSLSDPG